MKKFIFLSISLAVLYSNNISTAAKKFQKESNSIIYTLDCSLDDIFAQIERNNTVVLKKILNKKNINWVTRWRHNAINICYKLHK